jgi:hypothetical protein
MVNRHRGEVGAVLDGRSRVLVLTLGALAELEAAFGAEDLAGLAARFERGRLSARDLTRILGAGLRGAGETVSDAEVSALTMDGGLPAMARLAGELLAATFLPGEPDAAMAAQGESAQRAGTQGEGAGEPPAPFPGGS